MGQLALLPLNLNDMAILCLQNYFFQTITTITFPSSVNSWTLVFKNFQSSKVSYVPVSLPQKYFFTLLFKSVVIIVVELKTKREDLTLSISWGFLKTLCLHIHRNQIPFQNRRSSGLVLNLWLSNRKCID